MAALLKHFTGKKTGFLRHLYIKVIFLPRQARDKHRENSKKARFLEAYSTETNRGHDTYNISTFDLHDTYLPQYLLRSMLVWCKNG